MWWEYWYLLTVRWKWKVNFIFSPCRREFALISAWWQYRLYLSYHTLDGKTTEVLTFSDWLVLLFTLDELHPLGAVTPRNPKPVVLLPLGTPNPVECYHGGEYKFQVCIQLSFLFHSFSDYWYRRLSVIGYELVIIFIVAVSVADNTSTVSFIACIMGGSIGMCHASA